MNISFDFDETLKKHESLQDLAKHLIKTAQEVYILTARSKDDDNQDLYDLADSIRLRRANILFADKPEFKWHYIMFKDIDLHFENNLATVKEINNNVPNSPAVCVGLNTQLSDADK